MRPPERIKPPSSPENKPPNLHVGRKDNGPLIQDILNIGQSGLVIISCSKKSD